jgi:hypothetical protein
LSPTDVWMPMDFDDLGEVQLHETVRGLAPPYAFERATSRWWIAQQIGRCAVDLALCSVDRQKLPASASGRWLPLGLKFVDRGLPLRPYPQKALWQGDGHPVYYWAHYSCRCVPWTPMVTPTRRTESVSQLAPSLEESAWIYAARALPKSSRSLRVLQPHVKTGWTTGQPLPRPLRRHY